jgi:hypothetical protein
MLEKLGDPYSDSSWIVHHESKNPEMTKNDKWPPTREPLVLLPAALRPQYYESTCHLLFT